MRNLVLALQLIVTQTPWLPIATRTPGATNPLITQANIQQTICTVGWTHKMRPPLYETEQLKLAQITQWQLSSSMRDYEEDHLIPLEVGGASIDAKNLWPQPYRGTCGARVKDRVENALRRAVCSGRLTLADAQQMVSTDWTRAYRMLVGPLTCS